MYQYSGTVVTCGMENGTPASGEVTRLLGDIRAGNKAAESELLKLVYDDLRRLASRQMRREGAGHTLQTTALVHEAYLRLLGERSSNGQDRAHFFRLAAQTMRRILVDYARARRAGKRGGDVPHVSLDNAQIPTGEQWDDVILVDAALSRLATLDEQHARLVELRFFAGLTVKETAEALGISPRTVTRNWDFVQAWLYTDITGNSRKPDQTPS